MKQLSISLDYTRHLSAFVSSREGGVRDEMSASKNAAHDESAIVRHIANRDSGAAKWGQGGQDGHEAEVKWEKVLWRKQPFPDNYVPPTFLSELNALRELLL